MLEDEQQLVERAKGGESDAFGLLYDHYMPKIYRFVLFKVGRREEAEDLVHQTFLKAWERIDQYRFQGHSFGSWLYKIARNAIIDRGRKTRPDISIENTPDVFLVVKSSQVEETELSMQGEILFREIGKLKSVEQDVLIMRFVEDLPHQEIAKAVGKSEGAVKVIQHRAIKKLKDSVKLEP